MILQKSLRLFSTRHVLSLSLSLSLTHTHTHTQTHTHTHTRTHTHMHTQTHAHRVFLNMNWLFSTRHVLSLSLTHTHTHTHTRTRKRTHTHTHTQTHAHRVFLNMNCVDRSSVWVCTCVCMYVHAGVYLRMRTCEGVFAVTTEHMKELRHISMRHVTYEWVMSHWNRAQMCSMLLLTVRICTTASVRVHVYVCAYGCAYVCAYVYGCVCCCYWIMSTFQWNHVTHWYVDMVEM